jgi:hypothetical protein
MKKSDFFNKEKRSQTKKQKNKKTKKQKKQGPLKWQDTNVEPSLALQ